MLKCVEAQAEVLKEIIGHLFEIEKEEVEKYEVDHEPSKLTQEGINHVMAEGKVRLPLSNFKLQLGVLRDHGLSRGSMSMTFLNRET